MTRDWGCEECRREHEQLRAWLVELEQLKESGEEQESVDAMEVVR